MKLKDGGLGSIILIHLATNSTMNDDDNDNHNDEKDKYSHIKMIDIRSIHVFLKRRKDKQITHLYTIRTEPIEFSLFQICQTHLSSDKQLASLFSPLVTYQFLSEANM